MKKRILIIIIFIIIILLLFITAKMMTSKNHHRNNIDTVQVTKPIIRDEPLFFKIPGNVEASKSVTIRSKVTGIIKQIAFQPGQIVHTGQLLFQIDPASFIADLEQAKAELLKDKAQSDTLAADKQRYLDLYKKGFSSSQRYDQAASAFNENLAEIQADQAIIKQKEIALADTKIKTPINGKTGNVIVKTGDLVNANDTVLVTVNQLSPIFVNFHLTPQQINQLMPFYHNNTINADIYSENDDKHLAKGTLTFIDNTIDSNSGTVLLKITVPNSDHVLWPGQSVVVKLVLTIEKNKLVIPARAVQTNQQGDFVYLIKQNKVVIQPISVDRQIGHWVIISKGLTTDDTIAAVFPPNLKSGAEIKVITTDTTQASE